MRSIMFSLLLASTTSLAFAQAPAATTAPGNSAVNSPGVNNSANPVEGANSFTEAQAKSRIEGAGYGAVSGLIKDEKGIWRGKGTKAGKAVDVSVDFQGNVNPN